MKLFQFESVFGYPRNTASSRGPIDLGAWAGGRIEILVMMMMMMMMMMMGRRE
jgi:hypothetical protein